jgi:hypothetical protein
VAAVASQEHQEASAIKQGDPSLSDLIDFLNPSKSASAAAKIDDMDPSAPRLAGLAGIDTINALASSYDDESSSSYPLPKDDGSSVLNEDLGDDEGLGDDAPVAGSSISDVLAQYMNKGQSGALSVTGEV